MCGKNSIIMVHSPISRVSGTLPLYRQYFSTTALCQGFCTLVLFIIVVSNIKFTPNYFAKYKLFIYIMW